MFEILDKINNAKEGSDADMKLLNESINAQNEQKVAFESTTRLGKIPEDCAPRPLRVTVESEDDKELILKNAKSFRDSENQVDKKVKVKLD